MPSIHDLYCGRLLLKHKIVSTEQIWQALRFIHDDYRDGRVINLSAVLRKRGLLNEQNYRKFAKANDRHQILVREKLFARLVLELALATRDELRTIVQLQKQEGFRRGLGPMLVAEGLLDSGQLQELQAQLSVAYATTISKGEAAFMREIGELKAPFNADEERKILDLLNLSPGRKPKTEGLWSRQDAARASSGLRRSTGERIRADLLESTDGLTSPFASGRLAAPVSDSTRNPEDCLIYGYELIEQLGKGAMGVVYKARHIFSDRISALKVLPLQLAAESAYLERFKREAIASMRLQHENIVGAIDFGGSDEYYYLALEYVDGHTLEEELEQHGRVQHDAALCIALDICRGLDFAWKQNILHRDIKPENILLAHNGIAKLCDFGIVKLLDRDESTLTQAGTTVGTPYYISPEQARGEDDLDIRSDIYSLGITLFHAVTGQVPFTGKSQGAILVRHILEDVPDPRSVHPISDELAELINRMTRKKPEQRFQNPGEIIAAIEAQLG